MKVGEFCNRDVVVMSGDESVTAAAGLMRSHHVGDVVLVEKRPNGRVPVGIVTDRDVVVEVVAAGVDPDSLAVRDIVTHSAYVLREEDSLFDALEMMRSRAVRRVPVVEADGALAGIIAVDDVVGLLAELLDELSAVVERQREREAEARP